MTAVWRPKGQARALLWFSWCSYLLVSDNYSNRANTKVFIRVAFEKRDSIFFSQLPNSNLDAWFHFQSKKNICYHSWKTVEYVINSIILILKGMLVLRAQGGEILTK